MSKIPFIVSLIILFSNCNNNNSSIKVYNFTDGFIPDERVATKVAEAILPSFYGNDVLNERPFSVKLVGDTVWLVDRTLASGKSTNGGTAHVEIRKKDGTILKMIHGK